MRNGFIQNRSAPSEGGLERFEALHAPGAGTDHAGLAPEHANAVEALSWLR